MDFSLTEDQLMLQRTLRYFATNELEPTAAQVDEEGKLDLEKVKKLNELGVCGIGIPMEYGGSGGGTVETVIAVEELFHGCAGTALRATALLADTESGATTAAVVCPRHPPQPSRRALTTTEPGRFTPIEMRILQWQCSTAVFRRCLCLMQPPEDYSDILPPVGGRPECSQCSAA